MGTGRNGYCKSLGGTPSMLVVFVMIPGIGGSIIGPVILKVFKINRFLGKGIGIGSSSENMMSVSLGTCGNINREGNPSQ